MSVVVCDTRTVKAQRMKTSPMATTRTKEKGNRADKISREQGKKTTTTTHKSVLRKKEV